MAGYPTDNKNLIKDAMTNKIKTGIEEINNNLNKNLNMISQEMKKIPSVYKNMRNNLFVTDSANKRKTEEYIANTGSHTASGYAMSKRMNNQNAFNKELNRINIEEQNKISELDNKKREAELNAGAQINKLIGDSQQQLLDRYLKEDERVDNMALEKAKLDENIRLNNSKIDKTNADIQAVKNGIIIDNNEDKRKQEIHDTDMKYLDYEKQLGIEKLGAEIAHTNAKTDTEKSRKELVEAQTYKTKITPVSASKSGGSGNSQLSKMTPVQLAENINKQTGTLKFSHTGKSYYEVNRGKAYNLLMSWKNQFGLSNQVVNDTAIFLGIQDML